MAKNGIANTYAELIIKGIKHIDDVPKSLKEAVGKILEERGYVAPVTE